MEVFPLPAPTRIGRPIPKNAFDRYATAAQRKLFTDQVSKITWLSKLSPDTLHLHADKIHEIQIIHIELKAENTITPILTIIDKAIPYYLIFVVQYQQRMYLSTSPKHPHPTQEHATVRDWTFTTDWFAAGANRYSLTLAHSIDAIYLDFCAQLIGKQGAGLASLPALIDYQSRKEKLEKEILRLKNVIANHQQFNIRVEANIRLGQLIRELKLLK